LPDDPKDVAARTASCEKLAEDARVLCRALRGAEVTAKQACYLPSAPDGQPLIGRLPGYANAYICAGHTCWGILNGPASALALAELVAGRKPSVAIDAFAPGRFVN